MKNEFIRVRASEEEKEIITDKALSSYRLLRNVGYAANQSEFNGV